MSGSLHPEMCADEAMRTILRSQFEVLRRNDAAIREEADPERLHDFRVAVRRTRAGLGQIPRVFRRPVVRRFGSGFAWLGQTTGPARDLDVHRLALPQYRQWLGPGLGPALDAVEARLSATQALERRKVVAALDSSRYRKLRDAWGLFLAEGPADRPKLLNAHRPIVEVATERIRRAHSRAIRRGSAIRPDSPARDLHRVRIACKKLRYLLEFFAELYEGPDVARLVATLEKLQDNLGEHSDLSFQRDWLVGLEQELAPTGNGRTREAISGLIDRIGDRLGRSRARFESRFGAFREPTVAWLAPPADQ